MGHIEDNFDDASRDASRVSSGRWKRWINQFLILCWIVGLSSTLTGLARWSTSGVSWYENACVNGQFKLFPSLYTGWSAVGFFQITLPATGSLTYTEAKVIDLVWDVFVGRCGQAVLAFFSWRAFASYVTTSMEVEPVTFNTFRVFFLDSAPSLYSTVRLMRDLITRKGLYSRLASCFIVASITFTLLFPTLASAMTGYTTSTLPSIRNSHNASIPFTQFGLLMFTIHDGDRVNRTKDYPVLFLDDQLGPLIDENGMPYAYTESLGSWADPDNDLLECGNYWRGAANGTDGKSTWRGVTLDPPRLNITNEFASTKPGNFQDRKLVWVDSNTGDRFTKEYIENEKHGICQPTENYGWGFSFIQLYIVMVLLLLWSIGIYALSLHAEHIMRERGRTTIDGEYKAIVSLAKAMEKELNIDIHSENDEKDFQRSVQDARGGSISYQSMTLFEPPATILVWFRREKYWILVLLVTVAYSGSMPAVFSHPGIGPKVWRFAYYSWWVSFGIMIGLVSALLTCKSVTSRLALTVALTCPYLLGSFAFFVWDW